MLQNDLNCVSGWRYIKNSNQGQFELPTLLKGNLSWIFMAQTGADALHNAIDPELTCLTQHMQVCLHISVKHNS